ncbi:putative F-box protein [Gossypium australe]|uniref:Putative F-box protein n=1 Tax=Gossypium australe TaxID=47621 RepID=A0A5B6WMA5_9ROSI|nr:putative F-box protein [Gossypium australe]
MALMKNKTRFVDWANIEGCNGSKHCFYSISEAIFDVLYLPEIQGRKCWGSPFGWLVTYAPSFNSSVYSIFKNQNSPSFTTY